MALRIAFWFDFASTYSYLASQRIDEACGRAGVEVRHVPFLLGPLFSEQLGIKDSPFNVQPIRGRYMWRDLERLCEKYGLPWKRPSVFPRQSVLAARVLCAAKGEPELSRKIFRANFGEDRDIASAEVLAEIAGKDLVARAQAQEVKDELRANTDEARRLGIFGAPDFVVGGELFFGHDRMDDAIAWAKRGG
ncbi:MAG TPA: 2-hydroxychromene-2-carboxylate isomerase [Myxococcales bacterium]|jgi:2-hydroxychromene-2-carboxylate isomerase